MSFALKTDESAAKGVKRLVRKPIEKAVAGLRGGRRRAGGGGPRRGEHFERCAGACCGWFGRK